MASNLNIKHGIGIDDVPRFVLQKGRDLLLILSFCFPPFQLEIFIIGELGTMHTDLVNVKLIDCPKITVTWFLLILPFTFKPDMTFANIIRNNTEQEQM